MSQTTPYLYYDLFVVPNLDDLTPQADFSINGGAKAVTRDQLVNLASMPIIPYALGVTLQSASVPEEAHSVPATSR
jgi:hypothetical protein